MSDEVVVRVADAEVIRGQDGFSPIFSSEAIPGGHLVRVEDVNGPHEFNVLDGARGKTGATGAKGDKGDPGNYTKPNTGIPKSDLSAAVQSAIIRENLLDNWYFVGGGSQQGDGIFPINQQRKATYVNQGYCIDRWRMRDNNTGSVAIAPAGDGVVITINDNSGTGNTYKSLDQFLDKNLLLGKQVTLSCIISEYANTGVASLRLGIWAANDINYHSSPVRYVDITGPGLYRVTVNIPSDLSYTYLKCGILMVNSAATHGSASVKVKAIKLELGAEQTLAHQEGSAWVLNEIPNWAEELAKCQRYYFPIPSAFRINSTYRSSSSIDFSFSTPVSMIGTVRFEAPSAKLFASTGSGGAFEEQSGFSFLIPDNSTGNGLVMIRASKSGHGLLQATAIVLQPYTNAYLTTYPEEE